ncbi:MAG: glycosyltransferase [Magnetococcales bacterium]|nr:glycosyltransferase [Magnetococcales bacterium]MBF0150100.1 glycosyltransferase [Magnetococcales bacterium]MBF0172833.1 glycosyltransferase [Magnetococcales bacterium]MBF0347656.1 glycosyltransferase [Magnetococcales bacterium]MBF0631232.1 glycosyltransferase [Magnetococcales bacterium]
MSQPGGDGLSVVMMGRDEAHHLAESLPPLLKVADELIFVDTGSRDQTMDMVRAMGGRLIETPWRDDFSAPKNLGIDHARYSWILNVDCDEILQDVPRAGAALRHVCRGDAAPGWIVTIDNLMADGRVTSSQAIRLFQNHPAIRFANPVHESVARSLSLNWPGQPPLVAEGIRLRHLGYRGGMNRDKLKRNIAILRSWLEREPDNLFGCYKLGINLRHLGAASEGLFFLQKGFDLLDREIHRQTWPFAEKLVGEYFRALLEQGFKEKAEEVKRRVTLWVDGS